VLAKFFKRKIIASSHKSSLILQPNSVTLAATNGDVISVKQQPCNNGDFNTAISKLAQEADIAGADCQIVLGHGLYQIAQVEKPSVPESEYVQALLWSAKDLINIANENIILDYFEFVSNNPNNSKINVVACDQTIIKPIVELLVELEVIVKGISIVDIVLAQLLDDTAPTVLVFHSPGMNVLLAIIKEGQLCFSRHIKGYDNLHQLSEPDFQAGGLNNLGLEIQRCIDFAVGQLKLDAVANVSLFVQSFDAALMVDSLQELFDINVCLLEKDFGEEFVRYPLSALAIKEMELA